MKVVEKVMNVFNIKMTVEHKMTNILGEVTDRLQPKQEELYFGFFRKKENSMAL